MSTLALRLAGPLQSWGSSSRFTRRSTEAAPTKSGVLGLLASAQGRRRSDPIEDLLDLKMAVRIDQKGILLRDFHTAHHQITGKAMPLTERYYWSDAVFVAFVGGPRPLIDGLAEALANPRFPLYLGRRSCVPDGRVVLGLEDHDIQEALYGLDWQAGSRLKRRHPGPSVRLSVRADASVFPNLSASREINDVPRSWAQEHRQYTSRMVVDTEIELTLSTTNDAPHALSHDPMGLLEEE